jgi:hypothetical protein
VILTDVKPHSCQLVGKLLGGPFTAVCQKQKVLVVVVEPANEFGHTGKKGVAVIDYAVHVADEGGFLVKGMERYGRHKLFLAPITSKGVLSEAFLSVFCTCGLRNDFYVLIISQKCGIIRLRENRSGQD